MIGVGSRVGVEKQAMPELGEVGRTLALDDLAADFGPESGRR